MPETIFISFAKQHSRDVAEIIHEALTVIYPDPTKIAIFFSEVDLGAGRFGT